MQKWEYSIVPEFNRFRTSGETVARLNELGSAGWELVCLEGSHVILKRVLPDETVGEV